ncbi:hypothetical protein IJI18_02775 [Candidatus Saccharibacteria bacterium]|nr:hypothetical protein [Candidatus Saccharibacteria bacterium]
MNPEKNQSSSEENQNTAWDSLNDATFEKKTSLKNAIREKINNIETVKKAFAMVLLAASVTTAAAGSAAVYEQNRDKYDISASVDNLKEDWQGLKENAANTAEHIRDQINNIGKENTSTPTPIPPAPEHLPPVPTPTPPVPPEHHFDSDTSGNEAQRATQSENEVGGDNHSDAEEEAAVAEGNF